MGRLFRSLDEIDQDVVALTICDDNPDTCLRHLSGSRVFGVHATTAESTLLGLDLFRQVSSWSYLADQFCTRVVGMGVVDSVDI